MRRGMREEELLAAATQIHLSVTFGSNRLGEARACAIVIAILEEDPHRRSLSHPGRTFLEGLGGVVSRRCANPARLPERGGGEPLNQATA
jgi:hypothetical protein